MQKCQLGISGVVVNIHSTIFNKATSISPHYINTKDNIENITSELASKFGKHNIRVVSIRPNVTADINSNYSKKNFGEMKDMDDEIARIIAFLSTDLAKSFNGFVIPINMFNNEI